MRKTLSSPLLPAQPNISTPIRFLRVIREPIQLAGTGAAEDFAMRCTSV